MAKIVQVTYETFEDRTEMWRASVRAHLRVFDNVYIVKYKSFPHHWSRAQAIAECDRVLDAVIFAWPAIPIAVEGHQVTVEAFPEIPPECGA